MKNILTLIAALGLMLGFSANASLSADVATEHVFSTMSDTDKAYFNDTILQLAASDRPDVDLSDAQQQFLGGIIDKIKDAGGSVISGIKGLSAKAQRALNKLGITDEMLKSVPSKVLEKGADAVKFYIDGKKAEAANSLDVSFDLNSARGEYFLGDIGSKLKGVWDSVKQVGEGAWNAVRGLGEAGMATLRKLGVTDEMMKKVPADIAGKGMDAVKAYMIGKGLISAN